MKKLFFLLVLNLFGIGLLHATSDTLYPEIGKPCPEFLLKNVNYYKKKGVTLEDFKGKWLVLDFWNKHCIACVESFPKVNAMQKKFGDRVQFMLVGIQDEEGQIKPMYEHFKQKLNLTVPCAFDSTLSDYWGIFNTPHIVIIDDKGIVRARTFKVDSADIQSFLNGKNPDLSVIPYITQQKELGAANIGDTRISFDPHKPYMINGNGTLSDTTFLFRSVLTKWDETTQYSICPAELDLNLIDPNIPKGMVQVLGRSLSELYIGAYFGRFYWNFDDTLFYGKYSPDVILEVADSSLFQSNLNGKNMFCYSLIVPPDKGSKKYLQKVMQKDLETYFGFGASIEIRKVPYWRLVASDDAIKKLATKGGDKKIENIIPRVRYKFSNVPIKRFVQFLMPYTSDVIIDDTHINQNIDITTEFLDFDSMQAFLPKYGLKLIHSEKEMKVLVIHDEKNEN